MSVRNSGVKNCSKIAPFPPPTSTISDDRIASKRINDLRSTNYRNNLRNGIDYINNSDTENEQPSQHIGSSNQRDGIYQEKGFGKDQSRQIASVSGNMNIYTADYVNNKVVRQERGMGSEQTPERKQGSLKEKPSRTNKPQRTDTFVKDELTGDGGNSSQTQKPLRPKSARPESRWQRRLEDEGIDMVSDTPTKPSRPKSARPESRMMRMIEAYQDVDNSFIRDQPERPKTSHGRRASIVEDEVEDVSNRTRPKSRLGRRSDVLVMNDTDSDSELYGNDTLNSQGNNKSRKQNIKNKKSNQNSKTRRNNRIKSEGDQTDSESLSSFSNHGPTIFGTGSTMFDLNSKIDDIDLDVDPVEYFMRNDNNPAHNGGRKPSLSKDTIKCIGSTRKSNHDKAITGCHGYYHNKTYPTEEICDRYYSNDFQSSQYSISESNQSRFNQDPQGKINQRTGYSQRGALANGSVSTSRGMKNSLRYSKAEVSRDILAKYTAISSTNGYLSRTAKTLPYQDEFPRKPRKLDPIMPSNMKPY